VGSKTIKISFLVLFLFCLIAIPVFGAQLLYDPLDSADTVSANSGAMAGVSFAEGKKGNAAAINGYIDYPYAGKFNADAGTIQFLVKPSDSGDMGLFESGMLGLVGGAIGIALGFGISKGAEYIAAAALGTGLLKASFSWVLVAGALFFSFTIGALSGVMPAIQASRLKPVDALRWE